MLSIGYNAEQNERFLQMKKAYHIYYRFKQSTV